MTAAVELKMPLGYVEMDTEEMEYLEGGGTVTIKLSKAFVKKYVGSTSKTIANYIYKRFKAINLNSIYGALQVQYGAKIDKGEVGALTMRWSSSKLKSASMSF